MMEKQLKPQFENLGDALLARAPAKINLYLLIADKRPDGFHNLDTLMAKVSFYDELLFEVDKTEGIELVCDGLWSPAGKDNLVYKACDIFYKTIDKKPSVKINLTKNIPAGSGLGGASSDAATALLALNKLYREPVGENTLFSMTARLGSDVPFFLNGPQAICTGRGEKISKLDKISSFLALVVLPNISVSTKKVYDNYKVDLGLFNSLKEQVKPLFLKNRVDLITKLCANMLAKTCFALNNELAILKAKIENICRLPVLLSGSGSTLFVIFDNTDYLKAEFMHQKIKDALKCNSIIVFNNQW
ncbi:MAG: 4-(cytidine 5'-diphospho)-2-C-methyl-D-erythritol kinase [Sedimentisphaerales bacterium]